MTITKRISKFLTKKTNKVLHKEGKELDKLMYGMEVLIINVIKTIIIFSTALLVGKFFEIIVFNIVFASMRTFAFGTHGRTATSCTITSLTTFFGSVFLSEYLVLTNGQLTIAFIIPIILLSLYAPADTESRPLPNAKMRKILKIKTVALAIIFMIISLLLSSPDYNNYKLIIFFAVLWETIFTLPITYKLQRKGYKNYENFKSKEHYN